MNALDVVKLQATASMLTYLEQVTVLASITTMLPSAVQKQFPPPALPHDLMLPIVVEFALNNRKLFDEFCETCEHRKDKEIDVAGTQRLLDGKAPRGVGVDKRQANLLLLFMALNLKLVAEQALHTIMADEAQRAAKN